MSNIAKEILNALLDKYERSKLSKGKSLVNIKIKLSKDDKVLSIYRSNEAYLHSNEYDEAIKLLARKGYIAASFNNESFKELYLNLDRVDDIYKLLKRKSPKEGLAKINEVISKYTFDNFIKNFIEYLENYINEKGDYPKSYFSDYKQLELILKALDGILSLEENTMRRDFSIRVLNDSKAFERIEGKVCKILREFGPYDEDNNDDLLEDYYIIKNSTYALIKQGLVIKINNQIINLDELKFEMSLSDEMIDRLEVIAGNTLKAIVTVENLTSFYKSSFDSTAIIYLGGFHNHTKQKLLLKIYEGFPNINYYHWGDIDAGGFIILNSLRNKTGIPFMPINMGVADLIKNRNHLKELTDNDIKRLNALLENPSYQEFYETIRYMLANNIKLEQEIMD